MLDPRKNSDLEQGRTTMCEIIPPMWGSLFQACLKENFTREEALQLVICYTKCTFTVSGVRDEQ